MATEDPKPRRRRRPLPRRRSGSVILMVVDRYLVILSAGLVAGIWLVSDWLGLQIGGGTAASLSMFVGYAALKSKTDDHWRRLEIEREELRELVDHLEKAQPGSPEALQVRRELVALARRAQTEAPDHE